MTLPCVRLTGSGKPFSELPTLKPEDPVVLGFAAVEQFRAFEDKREHLPYR